MKKLFLFLAIAGAITACNNAADTSKAGGDTTKPAEATTPKDSPSAAAVTPAVKDSVMQFKDGKVMIMTGGAWSALTATVTTSNGRKVNPTGEIVSKAGKSRKMEEGMMIDKDGQLMDKDGKLMDNTGWE